MTPPRVSDLITHAHTHMLTHTCSSRVLVPELGTRKQGTNGQCPGRTLVVDTSDQLLETRPSRGHTTMYQKPSDTSAQQESIEVDDERTRDARTRCAAERGAKSRDGPVCEEDAISFHDSPMPHGAEGIQRRERRLIGCLRADGKILQLANGSKVREVEIISDPADRAPSRPNDPVYDGRRGRRPKTQGEAVADNAQTPPLRSLHPDGSSVASDPSRRLVSQYLTSISAVDRGGSQDTPNGRKGGSRWRSAEGQTIDVVKSFLSGRKRLNCFSTTTLTKGRNLCFT